MIRHLVFWRFLDHAEGRSKTENIALIRRMLVELKDSIPEIVSLEVGENVVPGVDAYDLALHALFASREDLESYIVHPEHQKLVAVLRKVRSGRAVVDFETGG
jgi:hypothetical protein